MQRVMPLSVIGSDPTQDFYARLVPRGGAVLILGAGDGALACALGRKGHDVVAVEPSSRLLAQAIERREVEAPTAALRFVAADVRSERLGRVFPAVFLPRNALALARTDDELAALLATVAAHLSPDGVFALDARVAPAIADDGGAGPRPRVTPHLRERTAGKLALHRLESFAVTAAHLDAALHEVGLEARERYQDFVGTPATDSAELQVVVGGRR